ncbi:MAG: GH36-type glycosyl hydrolase domain-containing protein [Anaerolineales bacterium]
MADTADHTAPTHTEERIATRGRRLAEKQSATRRPGTRTSPLEALPAYREALREAYNYFVQLSEEEGTLSGVGEWLLDNFYVIQQTMRGIRENLPEGYYRRLPKLDDGELQDYPRVYAIARALVSCATGAVDVDRVQRFTNAYQEVRPLTMGEVWAIPIMLRLSIIELLTYTVVDEAGVALDEVAAPIPSLGCAFGEEEPTAPPEVVVGNAIRSLRALEAYDWKSFFEKVSRVEVTLRQDPTGIYARMDFDTRDHYRKEVETLARFSEYSEESAAQEVVRLAEEAEETDPKGERVRHVGYYLIGGGRPALEAALDYHPPLGKRWGAWALDHPTFVYLTSIVLLTLLVVLGLALFAWNAGATPFELVATVLLTLIPASMVAVNLINFTITHLTSPSDLPKMDFSEGIPEAHPAFVVIPALLTSDEVDFLLQQIELHYLNNSDPRLRFALLTDFSDAPEEEMPEDETLLEQAIEGIRALNRQYDPQNRGLFYLLHRKRQWNPQEGVWMGWERKRGKIEEFNRLLLDRGETSYSTQVGNFAALPDIRYVITLDADTILPREAAQRLVGTLAHPLNRPLFDPETGQLIAGYTILQPRTEVKPTDAHQTLFTRIFTGDTGLDLYTRAVSDVYQDFFGEGIYVGKGIYDLEAFYRSLEGWVPENALLSHDLFEGIHGRAGLVTDIILYESYPPSYIAYTQRKHRWVRGDWQLLPWLAPRVPEAAGERLPNPFSLIDRWKIVDNLRRSLRTPALLALLFAGWVWLPGSAFLWTLFTLLMSAVPLVVAAVAEILRRLQDGGTNTPLEAVRRETGRWLLFLAFLPYETLLMADAIGTTLVRLFISHKRLLQWTTAAHTVRLFGRESKIAVLWQWMGGGALLAVVLGIVTAVVHPPALFVALPLVMLWTASPYVAYLVSQPIERERKPLTAEERAELRRLARRTWLYFERFVGPEDHWLPPDHFQEQPRGLVAHRTSPTNIGLLLLSTLGAYEIGYIGFLELTVRIRSTLETIDRMEKYRGHLLNWYDTRDLSTLTPRYVSTVDSGNMAACLIVLKERFRALGGQSVLHDERWRGLSDTLGVLLELVEEVEAEELQPAVEDITTQIQEIQETLRETQEKPERRGLLLRRLLTESGVTLDQRIRTLSQKGAGTLDTVLIRDFRLWAERIHDHLRHMQQEMDLLLPWLVMLQEPPESLVEAPADSAVGERWQGLKEALAPAPTLEMISDRCRRAEAQSEALCELLQEQGDEAGLRWCEDLRRALESARIAAGSLLIGLQDLSNRAEELAQAMEFGFLYDDQRKVFYLGYRVDVEDLDGNHYDLLASEARTTSLIAIAKGEVSQSHWLHLGRPLTQVDGKEALLSWNGSMFEYLMPDLWLRNYENTLLDQTDEAVVEGQMAYAAENDVPWGVSESAYYRFDAALNYQYRGFGIPGLGRKRGLGDDLVIAPYASLLALSVYPQEVMENIERLRAGQVLGHFGFYDAVDYTEARLPLGQERAIVRTYMAHHQGMIMVALTNYLCEQVIVDAFHADPRMQSVELLLQEQIPQQAPVEETPEEDVGVVRQVEPEVQLEPWSISEQTPLPLVHYLSNGRYGTLVTGSGGGYSNFQSERAQTEEPRALTRWRADTTLDSWGTWVYVQDVDRGHLWSAGAQPIRTAGSPEVRFYPHQAELRRQDHDIVLRTLITIAKEDNAEVRRVSLTNHSGDSRRLRLTSYAELVLADQNTDRRHPTFNKMFIESDYLPELNALLFWRRPRSAEEPPFYVAHLLVAEEGIELTGAHESDRERFLGRGRAQKNPRALESEGWLTGTTGATLDPIMALGQELEIAPHTSGEVAFVTLAADDRQQILEMARRFASWPTVTRVFDQASAQAEVELRNLNADAQDVKHFNHLLSALIYPYAALRAAPEILAANERGQSGLWPYAISGDYPLLLVRIGEQEEIPLIRQLLKAHTYWRNRNLKIDLVILNTKDTGYAQELSDQINSLIRQSDSDAWINRRGGIFILRKGQMDRETQILLQTAARVVLDAGAGALEEQLRPLQQRPTYLPSFSPPQPGGYAEEPLPPVERPTDLEFDNGFGGFTAGGKEYAIYLESGSERPEGWTPAPWINVIANPDFGFLVAESGPGFSWALNSGENRLTPWRNDPVSAPPAEALYLRDEETAEVWTPTPLPRGEDAPYLIRHGAGYSIFEHHSHGLEQRLRLFAAPDAPVKIVQLRLHNAWERPRRLTATYYAEWVLATFRDLAQQYIVPDYAGEHDVLLARNPYNAEFAGRVAFLAADRPLHGLTTNRTEFLGRERSLEDPAALSRVGLSGTVRAGFDPCAALQIHIDLQPGETQEVTFFLGQGADREETLALVDRFRQEGAAGETWQAVTDFWEGVRSSITVSTPERSMDLLLPWLLYQALSCRIWGRSALYQSSGAFGFRDQLQDVMSVVHARPEVAREHILRTAAHQFEEGDVLHWWHPPSGRGVRTRISDDLLWLPYVTAEYVETTGDTAVLEEEVPFREGEPLKPEEEERYGHYEITEKSYSLYEHCLRAIAQGTTSGPHGLPLMKAGDWNDGMNRVGIEGEGESVWLGWFLYDILQRFAPLCEARGDADLARDFREQAEVLRETLEATAWDGAWYRRGYYDDGTPLGSSQSEECQIDSLGQSWAVLSGAGSEERVAEALRSVDERLIREDAEIIELFTPPFDETPKDPGYIKGYPPGIRENGGQYTHAALWVVWAFAKRGRGERAAQLFHLLNPINHSLTQERAEAYKVEPYVVAADVYSVPPYVGHGGWTWYTGSSGWMYRLGIEAILGLHREGQSLRMDPRIPGSWPGFSLTYRYGTSRYHIEVDNEAGVEQGVREVRVDGERRDDKRIPLQDDGGQHEVQVVMGEEEA